MDPLSPEQRAWIAVSSDPMPLGSATHFAGWDALMAALPLPHRLFAGLTEPSPEDLAGASTLITWNPAYAQGSLNSGLQVILLGTSETAAVDPRVKLLRSPTRFLADLPLGDVLSALNPAPPVRTQPDQQSGQQPLSTPSVHIGHAGKKIPGAIGVDQFCLDAGDWRGDGRDLWFFQSQSVASLLLRVRSDELSHLLLRLQEATRILQPGGLLHLELPSGRQFDPSIAPRLGLQALPSKPGSLCFRKTQGRSFFVERESQQGPELSVLIVSEVHETKDLEAARLRASIESAQRGLANLPHEILILQRQVLQADLQANLRSCVAEIPQARLFEEQAPMNFGARHEYLRRRAAGQYLLILPAGDIAQPGCLANLLSAAKSKKLAAALPIVLDPRGKALTALASAGHGLLLAADAWPRGLLEDSPYRGQGLWQRFLNELESKQQSIATVPGARILSPGLAGRGLRGQAVAVSREDQALLARGRPARNNSSPENILVSLLRSMGDCILGSTVLDAIHARHPAARITLLTEERYAWLFHAHPAVAEIIAAPRSEGSGSEIFWAEDLQVAHLQEELDYEQVIILSDNLDHCPYFDCGLSFQDFYARLAGYPEAASLPLRLRLPMGSRESARERLREAGVSGDYAVLHTRAGWPERSPPGELFAELCRHLQRRGLQPVVVGGPGERIEASGVINLAGRVSPPESAGIIAEAKLFVGPDSGSLHMASACNVPSLGLYAGTGLRLVPPLASLAIAQQATSSCARPCGLSPCREGCNASGFDPSQLCRHMDALLDGRRIARDWFGERPAQLIAGPKGPVLLHSPPRHPELHPLAIPSRPGPGPGLEELPSRALLRPFPGNPSSEASRQAVEELQRARNGSPPDSPPESPLEGSALAAPARCAALHGLALASLLREDAGAALRYISLAIQSLLEIEAEHPSRTQLQTELRASLAAYTWPAALHGLFARATCSLPQARPALESS